MSSAACVSMILESAGVIISAKEYFAGQKNKRKIICIRQVYGFLRDFLEITQQSDFISFLLPGQGAAAKQALEKVFAGLKALNRRRM